MKRARSVWSLVAFWFIASGVPLWADGIVIPQVFYPKVEIPNQQALIHFSNGVERLVIETSFLGEGTNFAWVLPLSAYSGAIRTVIPIRSGQGSDSKRTTFRFDSDSVPA